MNTYKFRNGCMVETITRATITEAWAALTARWPSNWREFTRV